MRFISFTSGSCGNCAYLCPDEGEKDSGGILIDAGASMRRVKAVMAENGLSINDIGAVLVTHDHLDHIRYLGTFCKYAHINVCTTKKLHSALAVNPFTKDHISGCRQVLEAGEWNNVAGFQVRYFIVPHDATQTVGYAIRRKGSMFVLMTDLESVPAEAMELSSQADTVVIESNYDYDMLMNGPYPDLLKKRILNEGHLSNDACAEAIKKFYHPSMKNLFLCHLSGNNNHPQLAYDSAVKALEMLGVEKGSVNLRVLHRGIPGPLICL